MADDFQPLRWPCFLRYSLWKMYLEDEEEQAERTATIVQSVIAAVLVLEELGDLDSGSVAINSLSHSLELLTTEVRLNRLELQACREALEAERHQTTPPPAPAPEDQGSSGLPPLAVHGDDSGNLVSSYGSGPATKVQHTSGSVAVNSLSHNLELLTTEVRLSRLERQADREAFKAEEHQTTPPPAPAPEDQGSSGLPPLAVRRHAARRRLLKFRTRLDPQRSVAIMDYMMTDPGAADVFMDLPRDDVCLWWIQKRLREMGFPALAPQDDL